MLRLNPLHQFYFGRVSLYALTFVVILIINFAIPIFREVKMGESSADVVLKEMDMAHLSEVEKQEIRQQVEKDFHTGYTIPVRFLAYLNRAITFNFAPSVAQYPTPAWEIVRENVKWSLFLQIPAVLLAYVAGNFLGVRLVTQRKKNRSVLNLGTHLIASVPYFGMALMLVYLLSIKVPLFPSMGAYSDGTVISFSFPFMVSAIYHYVLPFTSLFIVFLSVQAVAMRSFAQREMDQEYVAYALQMGMSDFFISRYVIRNAVMPQLMNLTLTLGLLVGGALLVEVIFAYPGLGSALYTALYKTDFPVIQIIVLIVTAVILLLNFVIDVVVVHLDPRVKVSMGARESVR